jgi:hypothetical protein
MPKYIEEELFLNITMKKILHTDDYTFEGELINHKPNGLGIKEYETGDVFIGEFLNGKDSKGLLKVQGKDWFLGELSNDMPTVGIFYSDTGKKFISEIISKKVTPNQTNLKPNIGIMTFNNGSKFVGEFTEKSGRPLQGTMFYKSGFKFIGTFKRGKPVNGTRFYKNGVRFIREFDSNGKPMLGIVIYPDGRQSHLNPVVD